MKTFHHIWTENPVFSKIKYDIKHDLDVNIVIRDLHSILKGTQRNIFLSYCSEIVKKNIKGTRRINML